jgi:hypothetical protein
MAATANDLPDPLKDQPPSAGLSTDDLLAKMAADEIDHLLEEANAQSKQAPISRIDAALPQVATPEQPAANVAELDAQTAQQLDRLMEELQRPENEEAAKRPLEREKPLSPAHDLAADAGLAQQLDALFEQLNAGVDPPRPKPAPGAAAMEASAVAGAMAGTARQVQPEEQIAPAEKQALAQATPPDTAEPQLPEGEQRAGLVLRILDWINMPLDYIGGNGRLIAGRVAIVTLFNALAVLVYVVFFRKT